MENLSARIILKSSYLNPSKNDSGGSGTYAQYIGTRDGAVKISEDLKDNPSSDSQKEFIDEIIRKFPEELKSISYHEYERNQTIGNASEFISDSVKKHKESLTSIDGYAAYMATRPGVVKMHETGLFSDGDKEVKLDDVKEELKNYKGNVYLPIISLRPEDSIGLHYDNPEKWHELLERHRDEIAKEYHIQPENMRWVAAYHHAVNDDNVIHNHVHMMIWSKNPNEGWQTKATGTNIKRILANDIFQEEHLEVLKESSKTRDEIKEEAINKITELVDELKQKDSTDFILKNELISKEMVLLADKLKDYKGRKFYGYMKPEVKTIIDNITDDIFRQNPELDEMYKNWTSLKDAQVQVYQMGHVQAVPPSQNKEFNKIKNEIIKEALKLSEQIEKDKYNELKVSISAKDKNLFMPSESDRVSDDEIEKIYNNFKNDEDFFSVHVGVDEWTLKERERKKKATEEKLREKREYTKGLYHIYTPEEFGGDAKRAEIETQLAMQRAYKKKKKEEIKKATTALKKDINKNNGDVSKVKLTKSQKKFLQACSTDYSKPINRATVNRADKSISSLMSKAIGSMLSSGGVRSGHHHKNEKLAVDFDEEEFKRKLALGMHL